MRLVWLALLGASLPLAAQSTIRVPADVPTIQQGIDLAQDGDTVLVAPGRHVGVLDFLGKAITVRSESGAASTIIDGHDGSLLPAVSFQNDEGTDSVLRGFTVTGAENRYSDVWGGGISCVYGGENRGTPTIQHCVITGNRSWYTPGVGVVGNPVLEDCVISGNFAESDLDGGGVWGAPTLRRCTVTGNLGRDGGGIYLYYTGASALIEDSVIIANYAGEGNKGAGIYAGIDSVLVRRCLIVRNQSSSYGGMSEVQGAAVHVSPGVQARFEHCTIVDNTVLIAGAYGQNWGGIHGSATLVNCIVSRNDHLQVDAGSTISYSNIEGGYAGTGNIDLDALFVDPANGDYHLRAGSPCIDAGDPAAPLDPDGTRADLGAFPFAQANTLLRNGTGRNRVAFSSLTPPVVGGTWTARIDSSGHRGVRLAGFVLVKEPLATPRTLPFGELLIDLGRPLARARQRASGGPVDFTVSIPASPALIGFGASAQAILLGGRPELLNALDLRFGN